MAAADHLPAMQRQSVVQSVFCETATQSSIQAGARQGNGAHTWESSSAKTARNCMTALKRCSRCTSVSRRSVSYAAPPSRSSIRPLSQASRQARNCARSSCVKQHIGKHEAYGLPACGSSFHCVDRALSSSSWHAKILRPPTHCVRSCFAPRHRLEHGSFSRKEQSQKLVVSRDARNQEAAGTVLCKPIFRSCCSSLADDATCNNDCSRVLCALPGALFHKRQKSRTPARCRPPAAANSR